MEQDCHAMPRIMHYRPYGFKTILDNRPSRLIVFKPKQS
jgi:hypothetical protein